MDPAYVATCFNTVELIGVVVAFLPLQLALRLKLRLVHSRWNLGVCESVRKLKCKAAVTDAAFARIADVFSEVRSLSLSWCQKLTSKGLADVGRLKGLTTLDLEMTATNDAVLEHITALPGLTALSLAWCGKLTDVGGALVCSMPQLAELDLRSPWLSAAIAEGLAKAPRLTSLRVTDRLKSPDALSHLVNCPRLSSLTALGIIDAASFDQISRMTGLTALDVSNSVLIYGCMAKIGGTLRGLTSLSVQDCGGMDDGQLEGVFQLAGLTRIDVSACFQISDSKVEQLRNAIPGLVVVR